MTRSIVALVLAVIAIGALNKVARELHAINYQMTLTNCMAQADRGATCEAAKDKS